MIEGHQRITCIFVVGCNNIEIRTCEVVVLKYETRIAEIGFTSCSFENAQKVIYHWLNSLPVFKNKDIVIHDGIVSKNHNIILLNKEDVDDNLIEDVYCFAELGRWGPSRKKLNKKVVFK